MAPTITTTASPAGFALGEARRYPLFHNPDKYMEVRQRPGLRGRLKQRREARAIDRALADVLSIRSLCDVPAGPGRLFHHWRRRGWRVDAFDLSDNMVARAAEVHRSLGLEGRVRRGNAFALENELSERPDLIACVRFAYYFDTDERIALWRSLGEASGGHVLIHFKVRGLLASMVDRLRRGLGHRERLRRHPRRVLTRRQIASEVEASGLRLVRFVRSSPFSLACYALAERVPSPPPRR